jgi:hypothetical protein
MIKGRKIMAKEKRYFVHYTFLDERRGPDADIRELWAKPVTEPLSNEEHYDWIKRGEGYAILEEKYGNQLIKTKNLVLCHGLSGWSVFKHFTLVGEF